MNIWCNRKDKGHLASSILLGLALMGMGGVLYARHMGFLDITLSRHLWPWVLVFFGVLRLIARGPLHWGGHAMILGGLFWLLGVTGHHGLAHQVWPLALVWVGMVMVLRSVLGERFKGHRRESGFCEDAREDAHDA
nr:hypothetical protein [uncultured Holophaga sp.]